MVSFVSLTILVIACGHCTAGVIGFGIQNQDVWWNHLPEENLTGVPQRVLDHEKYYPAFKDIWLGLIGRTGHNENHVKEARRRQKLQTLIDDKVQFPCDLSNTRSKERPVSAHQVRPGDIDIVAAMGDSLTAGNGALAFSIEHVMVENRGISTAIGGQANWKKYLTIPNILKEFNPKLFGYSTADSFTHHTSSQFNVAEIGAMSQDMPFMARQLVKRIKRDPRVDFQNDWKLVNVLIGSNNFCIDICYLKNAFTSVQGHKNDLYRAFEFLRDNMPRTIVSILQSPNLKVLVDFENVPPKCELLHKFECPCLFTLQHEYRRKEFFQVMEEWQKAEEEVAYDDRFKSKEDFTIIVQPLTKNLTFPKTRYPNGETGTDFTYMSDDCFHLSQKGYSRISNALWNNMLEPVGRKSTNWKPEFEKFICPSESSPYVFTWKNSVSP